MSRMYVIELPKKSKDFSGKRFGRLTVLEYTGKQTKSRNLIWKCQCDCGTLVEVAGGHLTDDRTQSCGCLIKQITSERSTTHGHTKNNKSSSTYISWRAMIDRCYRHKTNDYKNYGGRGISVCERWMDFNLFLEDMGERPIGFQIDRIDCNGNYEPSNCRWATIKQQSINKRTNKKLNFEGITMTIAEWSEKTGIPRDTLWHRVYTAKWQVHKALTEPLRKRIDNRVNLSKQYSIT